MNADPKGMARTLNEAVGNILDASPLGGAGRIVANPELFHGGIDTIRLVAATLENVIEPSATPTLYMVRNGRGESVSVSHGAAGAQETCESLSNALYPPYTVVPLYEQPSHEETKTEDGGPTDGEMLAWFADSGLEINTLSADVCVVSWCASENFDEYETRGTDYREAIRKAMAECKAIEQGDAADTPEPSPRDSEVAG